MALAVLLIADSNLVHTLKRNIYKCCFSEYIEVTELSQKLVLEAFVHPEMRLIVTQAIQWMLHSPKKVPS